MADLDFSDLGAEEVKPLDFSDLGAVSHEPEKNNDEPKNSLLNTIISKLGQGVSGGFSDELAGGLSAAGRAAGVENLGGKIKDIQMSPEGPTMDPQKLLEAYRATRDKERDMQNQMAKERPVTSGVSNLVGGGALALAAPQVLMNPLGSAAEGAPLLQKMAQGAINTIPSAALLGVGNSNADLTQGQVGQLGTDLLHTGHVPVPFTGMSIPVPSGAVGSGLAFGAGMPLAGAAISGTKNAIVNSNSVQDLLDAYKEGIKKTNLHAPDFLVKSRDQLKALADKVDDSIRTKVQSLFKDKNSVLNELEQSGVKADTKSVIQGLANAQGSSGLLKPDESRAILSTTKNIMESGYLKSPQEIEKAISQLKDLKGSVETTAGHQMVDNSINQLKALQNSMDPRIQNINDDLFQVIDSGKALTGNNSLDYADSAKVLGTENKLANKFQKMNEPSTASDINDILNTGLKTSKNRTVAPLSEMVPETGEAFNAAKPIVRNMDLASKIANQSTPGVSTDLLTTAGKAIASKSVGLANSAGQGVAANKEFLQKGIQHLSDATPDQIKTLASNLTQTGGKIGAEYARVLGEAAGKNNVSKNAIMFGLMQQPEFRQLFQKSTEDTSQNGQ